jgi:S1-C subfamily serine protease
MKQKIVFSLMLVLLLGACSAPVTGTAQEPSPLPSINLHRSDVPPPHSDISKIIQDVLPSVVNVRVTALTSGQFGLQQGKGEGSGVVIDKQGIILTNNHVVEDATKVTVVFNDEDRTHLEGEVVGTVPERDLAIIKVDADDLDAIEIGQSDSLLPGDEVVAIGYPLGLGGYTVTKGIISATSRTIRVPAQNGGTRDLEGLLQTDAAINPGNSGGALIDRNGRLVGINTAAAQPGAAENIGFAISMDAALPVIEQILTQPRDQQAWLGVSLAPVDSAGLAGRLGIPPDTRGALIVAVVPSSPAEKAGLSRGDVIVKVGEDAIDSDKDLVETLTRLEPGATVELQVVSSSGSRSFSVELARRPASLEQ